MNFRLILSFLILGLAFETDAFGQTGAIDHWETAIYAEDIWRYMPGSVEPDTNWRRLTFADSLWFDGMGGIGYGDGDDHTIIAPAISVYLRMPFDIIDTGNIGKAILHADYDDSFVAFINNVEVARSNIGVEGDHPLHNQLADTDREATLYQGDDPEAFVIGKEALRDILLPGPNILAIQVHNIDSNSSDLSAIFYLSLGIMDSGAYYGSLPPWFYEPIPFVSSNLPIVVINTNGQEIPDEPRIIADMGIIDNGPGTRNLVDDPFNNYSGRISIEIRGSSSQGFPKLQYALETRDTQGNNNNVSLMGLPKENDWILYAPFSDKSLIRNVMTYHFARRMGRYAPRTRFCELILNDEYQGIYVLTEKIKRDKNRVDIARLDPDDLAGDSLTGGYIFKIDRGDEGWHSSFPAYTDPGFHTFFVYHYPKAGDMMPEQQQYIHDFVETFETVLRNPGYDDPQSGYAKYIDVGSFIDFLISSEFAKNIDSYYLSTFLYKDKDSKGGKLTMGPLWDYNLAYGNVDYSGAFNTEGWQYDIYDEDGTNIPFWWARLLEDTAFQDQLKCRWQELRQGILHLDSVFHYIDSVADHLEEAQARNFERWPVLGEYVWPNFYVGQTYEDELNYLKSWIGDRVFWLDNHFPGTCTAQVTSEKPTDISLPVINLSPNPFTHSTLLTFDMVNSGKAAITIKDITGRDIGQYILPELTAGHQTFRWYGKDGHGRALPAGCYLISLHLDDCQKAVIKVFKQ